MSLNIIISAFVGGVASVGLLVGGVHVAQGDQTPVSESQLYTYASE